VDELIKDEGWRGNPGATGYEDLKLILKLSKATSSDIFCDLGCGNGDVCRWTSKNVKSVFGVDDDKNRFLSAKRNIKKFRCDNVKILNEKYGLINTLRKLKSATIFYCTNEESLGFYRKFEKVVNPETRFVTYYLPPYPIKPDSFDDWYYLMTTPFSIAKSKKEWVKTVTHKGSFKGLIREIKRDFEDHEEKILDLDEGFKGVDWIRI